MAKSMILLSKLTVLIMNLLIITCLGYIHAHNKHDDRAEASTWAKTVALRHQRKTTLQFYFHDTPSGKSPTTVRITQPSKPNGSHTGFGVLNMADDTLTIGPNPNSKLVGRAQGLYGFDSQEEASLIMALSFTFNDGIYNRSSLSILSRNSVIHPLREVAVVGGTGVFRMARGYAILRTYWWNATSGAAIVGYNVTVVHS